MSMGFNFVGKLMLKEPDARKDFYHLIENVNQYNEPMLIVGKKGNAVLLSEEDWNAIQETLGKRGTRFFCQRKTGMQYRRHYFWTPFPG